MEQLIREQILELYHKNKEPRGILMHKKDYKNWLRQLSWTLSHTPQKDIGVTFYMGVQIYKTKDIKKGAVIVF